MHDLVPVPLKILKEFGSDLVSGHTENSTIKSIALTQPTPEPLMIKYTCKSLAFFSRIVIMKLSILLMLLVFLPATAAFQTSSSLNSDPKFISAPEFTLSAEATAARIEGNLNVGITVDKTGKVKNVQIWSLPAYPCDTNPKKEINEVLDAVKRNVIAAKFQPAIVNGKPHDSDFMMTFTVGKTHLVNKAQKGYESVAALDGAPPPIVEVGSVNKHATSLPHPYLTENQWGSISSANITAQVLIDETGKVVLAGIITGYPTLFFPNVRRAACTAKFNPFTKNGQPIQVSGIIEYHFPKGPYIPKIITKP